MKNKEEIKTLKQKYTDYLYYANGFDKLSGAYVKLFNFKVYKRKKLIVTDAVFFNGDSKEHYYELEYSLDFISSS